MGRLVGIDLGTTNSVVAVMDGPQPRILHNREGRSETRSVVGLRTRRSTGGGESTELMVGDPAIDNWGLAPENTVVSIKRLMGRGVSDPETQKVREWAQYRIVAPSDGTEDSARVVMGGREYSPIEVSAMVLSKLKEDAEYALGEEVTHAVITVPAYFSHVQKDATRRAGLKAGLKVIRLLDEPTAAAVAYGIDSQNGGDANTVLVYDLGGGTFDISVLVMAGGTFAPLNLEGDMWLGGDNFDQVLVEHVVDEVRRHHPGVEPTENHRFMVELKKACQKAKETLSSARSADIIVAGLLQDRGALIDVDMQIGREEFEAMIRPLVDRTTALVGKALENASLSAEEIDFVLMAGNSTMTPLVQQAMEGVFGASKVLRKMHPKQCVALGAATVAAVIGPKVMCPNPDCESVNDDPDAESCASCGATLELEKPPEGDGAVPQLDLSNVAPFHYGAQMASDAFAVFVRKGDPVPTEAPEMRVFKTRIANQRMISIPIFGGDDLEHASTNERQGEAFAILRPGLGADTPVRVRLWLDANGTFRLSAHLEDGTDLTPWVVEKGEAQWKAILTLEQVERLLGAKAGIATSEEMQEVEEVRERVFGEMRAGRFSEALGQAERLQELAEGMGAKDQATELRERAETMVNFAVFVGERYGWAFQPAGADRLRDLIEKTRAALKEKDPPLIETRMRQLAEELDDMPAVVKELFAIRFAIGARIQPHDPSAAAQLETELREVEDAFSSGDRSATHRLESLGEKTLAVVRRMPGEGEPCATCGTEVPPGERYCPNPSCRDDTWRLKE